MKISAPSTVPSALILPLLINATPDETSVYASPPDFGVTPEKMTLAISENLHVLNLSLNDAK